MTPSTYPEIEDLERLAARLDGTFDVEPASDELRALSVCVIRMRVGRDEWRVACFDEFGDADRPSRVVRLHLVLDACVCFEEAEDFDTWRRDLGLPDEPPVREMHAGLARVVPSLRERLGTDAKPIDERAIEFGTDLARALRACLD